MKTKKILIKESIINSIPTIIGIVLFFGCVVLSLKYLQSIKDNIGVLFPVVLIFLMLIILKLINLIPRPIHVFEENE